MEWVYIAVEDAQYAELLPPEPQHTPQRVRLPAGPQALPHAPWSQAGVFDNNIWQ